jgi:hypothetical protein
MSFVFNRNDHKNYDCPGELKKYFFPDDQNQPSKIKEKKDFISPLHDKK